MADPRDAAAQRFEAIAKELDLAAGHWRVTAARYRERDVPRAAAHAWAAYGHLHRAQAALHEMADLHASMALPPASPSE
ncbi:MAG: hypothetical protein M3281_05105 [Chloroflexota bacterium]|nr:hypothetical protein [Chloroflexota bacterium]